jgi:hypothetical protein
MIFVHLKRTIDMGLDLKVVIEIQIVTKVLCPNIGHRWINEF